MPRLMSPARRDALAQGRRFYQGPPCKYGHGLEAGAVPRYSSTNACQECVANQVRPAKVQPAAPVDLLAELLG